MLLLQDLAGYGIMQLVIISVWAGWLGAFVRPSDQQKERDDWNGQVTRYSILTVG